MGDPKFPDRQWLAPSHPWQGKRIEEEREIVRAYGLKNHREIWKLRMLLRNWRNQARRLMALTTEQARKEEKQLIGKIASLGILKEDAALDDVLTLEIRDLLERRLQTLVMKKGIASTVKKARQYITHGHIGLGNQKIDSPGYLVPSKEEDMVGFYGKPIIDGPAAPVKKEKREEKPIEKKKEEEKKEPEPKVEEKKEEPKPEEKAEKLEGKKEEKKEEKKDEAV